MSSIDHLTALIDPTDNSQTSLALLQAVTRAVNASFMIEAMIETLADVLAEFIPFTELSLVLLDDTLNGITLRATVKPGQAADLQHENNRFVGTNPVLHNLLQNGRSAVLPLVLTPSLMQASDLFLTEGNDYTMALGLSEPLQQNGQVQGLLTLGFKDTLSDRQQACYGQWLHQLAETVAIAVANAKLYWKIQAQSSQWVLINRLTHAMRISLDISDILSTTVSELGRVMGVSRCIIRYQATSSLAPQQQNPETTLRQYSYTLPGVSSAPKVSTWDQTMESHVFALRQANRASPVLAADDPSLNPFVLNHIDSCPLPLQWVVPQLTQLGVLSLVIIPVMVGGQQSGSITLHQCDNPRPWTEEDMALLLAVADHLGVALAQAQLYEQQAQQTQALEAAMGDLQTAQLQLIQSEKMAVLGQFVAGIAHEVNTPLGAIASNNDTLSTCLQRLATLPAQSITTPLLATMDELLQINAMASHRIQDIVTSLRNFARLDESEQQVVNLHEGINNTLILLRGSIPPHVQVTTHFDADCPPIRCYPGLLNQVFINLMVNALHAMDTPNANQSSSVLSIGTHWNSDTACLSVSVSDTGRGICVEHLPRIFDPGFTTKGVGVGTGLGLALCYRIMEKHNGHIMVDSTLGKGSTFTVVLTSCVA
jgi:two-component system, NtrC family, sensor kinase